jgi:hypothetical protein
METRRNTTGLGLTFCALLLWTSGGCSSEPQQVSVLPAALETNDNASDARESPAMLASDRYYSAFDGEHEYQIALAPNATADRLDPLDLSRVVWRYDSAYFRAEPYPELSAGVLLTPLRAGNSTVRVTATTESGQSVCDSAEVEITGADPALWPVGDAAFNDAAAVRPQPLLPESCADVTHLPSNKDIGATGCPSCHNPSASITVPLTNQLQAFSDDELIRLYSEGVQPAGYEHVAAFMRTNLEARDEHESRCLFSKVHAWQMSDELQHALLLKIRSELPYEAAYDP